MNNTIKLYIDADDTILDSSRAIIELLNQKYDLNKTYEDLNDWNYSSIAPTTKQEIDKLYSSKEFFDTVKINEEFLQIYNKYLKNDNYEIIIVTKGNKKNLAFKQQFFNNNFPEFKFKGIEFDQFEHFIKPIDMSDGIQIDDRFDCLDSNAAIKILYKQKELPWNAQTASLDNLYVTHNWDEICKIVTWFSKFPKMIVPCWGK